MTEKRVLVAMSGGVDSSTAAWLLSKRGYEVTGLFMRTGSHGSGAARGCCSAVDARDARRVADRLGIPFYAVDFEREFAGIVRDFVEEYRRGRTPNPCILCNRDVKFGRLHDYARAAGADLVATGHYARVVRREGRYAVARGRDPAKDQSYVLFPLTQEQLARTLLPLGDLEKDRVRELARQAGLGVAGKPDSQEVCFVPEGGYRELLAERGVGTPGAIVDGEGRELGRHEGVEHFTVGQRRGLKIAAGRPLYVTGLEPESGLVRVGSREDLLRPGCTVGSWQAGARPEPAKGVSLPVEVQIRYRHRPAAATLTGLGAGRVRVRFDRPQSAVTPGQAAVAYEGNVVVGGGWIERPEAR